jgi:hypothetical protein
MSERGLAALYRALREPTGPHLDDEMLALVVDAELAGEDVDTLFNEQMTHVGSCESCAANYSELLVMMQGIVGEMALEAEKPDAVTMIWNRALGATADIINNKLRLTFTTPLPQLGESKPVYETGDERILTRQTIPGPPPLTVEARLSRLSPLTCRLTIQLEGEVMVNLAGYRIGIRYGEVEETAETNKTGSIRFDNIPIAALSGLEITIEG